MPAVLGKSTLNAVREVKSNPTKQQTKPKLNARKTESIWERLSQPKRKPNIVPEMDFLTFEKSQHKRHNSAKKSIKDFATKEMDAQFSKTTQMNGRNDFSKLRTQHQPAKLNRRGNYCEAEPRISVRSVDKYLNVEYLDVNPSQFCDHFFQCDERDVIFRSQFPDFENSSEFDSPEKYFDGYDLPSVSDLIPSKKSPGPLQHFQALLNHMEDSKTNILEQKDVDLLKDIVKADERYQQLRKNDYILLKDILTGQLEEISHTEQVIQVALNKIRDRRIMDTQVTILKDKAEQPMENLKSINSQCGKEYCDTSPRQDLDVILQNMPSSQKMISNLPTFGSILEETPKLSEIEGNEQRPLILYPASLIYFSHQISYATFRAVPMGVRILTDKIKEFEVRYQTIDELRLEKEFYIPSDYDVFTLEKTNFEKLRRNPERLLRRLKPFAKDTILNFNYIEQDPMFFNNFLVKMCKMNSQSVDDDQMVIPKRIGAGDHLDIIFDENADTQHQLSEVPTLDIPSKKSLGKRYAKQRKRFITPLGSDKTVTPKNRLLKTILVGVLHLLLFFTITGAIFYPEITCH